MEGLQKPGPEKTTPLSLSNTYVDGTGEHPKEEAAEIPEGGIQGWLTVVGAALVQFCGLGYITTFGVYQDFYVRKYLTSYSPSEIGWIGGVQVFLNFSLGILTGPAFDRGYFRHLMISSVILNGLALFMLSLSQENHYYQIFLAQGICFGLSSGLTYVPTFAIVSHYFKRRRPLAMGLVSGGSSLGAVVHPIMLNQLLNGRVGFHNGIRISASLNVFLLIVANIITRARLPARTTENRPPLLEILRDPPYICLTISLFLAFCGLYFPFFYLQLDAIYYNINHTLAFYVLSILNASNSFGRIIPPIFVPWLGVYNVFTSFTVVMGIALLCMTAVKGVTSIVLVAIFYGFFSGGAVALAPAVLGALARDLDEVGARIGIAFGFSGIMAMFAQPIAGALLTAKLKWLHAILFAGLTILVSVIFALIARQFVSRRKRSWRV